ncbi:MAG: glycosyltransferase family 4 protein [Gemmatimonadaceae bacterium]
MKILGPVFLLIVVVFCSFWLTGRFRRYALAQRLLDLPNARSSHDIATPRGGGVAITSTMVVGLLATGVIGIISWSNVLGLAGGGALVAWIGFRDDKRHIAPQWRLMGHFVAAAWFLAWLAALPPFSSVNLPAVWWWAGQAIAAVYIVWLLNLTNFMDGIDGLAGIEAVTVCVGGGLLYVITARTGTLWLTPLLLAAATLGFLIWNWPPAEIFMGDVGSGFLGFMMAGLSLQAASVERSLFWSWLILLGVFIVDATVTLVTRIIRGKKFYEPHRSHAYQNAARRWGSHRQVTLAVGLINSLWLLPIAIAVGLQVMNGLLGLLVAYLPLVLTAIWLKAGRRDAGNDFTAERVIS